MYLNPNPRGFRPSLKILVIDEDPSTANTIVAAVGRGVCEVIACRDMAMAEVAIDFTDFDLILVAPETAGVDGLEGLAVTDFLAARNPSGSTSLLLREQDADLRAVAERRGASVLSKPIGGTALQPLLSSLSALSESAVNA